MKHLIYNSEIEAQKRCDKAFADMNCQDVNTIAYAIPQKHPEKELYAVCIDDNYTQLFSEQEINEAAELTEDWFPKIEMPNI